MSYADNLAMLKDREDLLVNELRYRRETPAKVEKLKKVRLAIAALEGRLRTRDESCSESRSPSRSRGRRHSRSRSRSSNAPPWATEDDRWLRKQSEKMDRDLNLAIHKQQQQIGRDYREHLRRFR
jgi:hypothetical protein